ncbi:MAG: DUF721 domain-containing protein [Bacteroidetes bacterium]|nr:MAG: DUF721 domain-containing protein [Bacteroidota bacterium]
MDWDKGVGKLVELVWGEGITFARYPENFHGNFTKMEKEQSLKEVLRMMVSEMKWDHKLSETRIKEFWTKKMGTTINQYTKELKLRGGKLFITLESSPVKQELSYEREKLRKTLNQLLGDEVIKDIIIR